ncbi:MAG: hypothetical protein IKW70_03965, partial [Verrucomicrobia bacterium]|nr:hypothetical protein [Verrucomicrobiota bacterium]
LLENKSDEVKCLAAFGVADYCTDPKESISILMDRFTKETSPIVRIAFIKFSGQIYREFPDSDKNFLTTLEKIAKDENNEDKVRKVAQFVLKDITEQESISEEQT